MTSINSDIVLFNKLWFGDIASSEYKSKTTVITEFLYIVSGAEGDLSALNKMIFANLVDPKEIHSMKLDTKLLLDLVPAYCISSKEIRGMIVSVLQRVLTRVCTSYAAPKHQQKISAFVRTIVETLVLEYKTRASFISHLLDFSNDSPVFKDAVYLVFNEMICELPLSVIKGPSKFKGPLSKTEVRNFLELLWGILESRESFRDVLSSSYGFIHSCVVLIEADESTPRILDILLDLVKGDVKNIASWIELVPALCGLSESKTEGVKRRARQVIKSLYLEKEDGSVQVEILNEFWKSIDFHAIAGDSFEYEMLSLGEHKETIKFLMMRKLKQSGGGDVGNNDTVMSCFVTKMVESGC
jgi:hypothetical protein